MDILISAVILLLLIADYAFEQYNISWCGVTYFTVLKIEDSFADVALSSDDYHYYT